MSGAAEEFLFGRLSRPDGRLAEARAERAGLHDLAGLQALDPLPGQPIHLRFRCGVDLALARLHIFWTADGSRPQWDDQLEPVGATQAAAATASPPLWDTLGWGYLTDWLIDLPPQADGAMVRYAAVGVDAAGRAFGSPWPGGERHGSPEIASVGVDRLEPPGWLRRAILYQVFVDRFAPSPGRSFAPDDDLGTRLGGTLWGLLDRLDDLTELGVDTLWLTPIFASPDYHGYATSDLFRVEPALGGDRAWQELAAACREKGLRLVLDFVANHLSDRHPAFLDAIGSASSLKRSWFRFRHWPNEYAGFFDQPHQPEIDAEDPGARAHLLAAASHWLGLGCNGYRLDYAHGLSHGFWSEFRAATRAAAPESACFGEVTHTPQVVRSYAGRMDGCLDFGLCELLRATFARAEVSVGDFARLADSHQRYFGSSMVRPSFLDNHDMNRFVVVAGGDLGRLELAALVQFLMPGPPIIYYGTEVGLGQRRPIGRLEEARLPMPPRERWDHDLRSFYRSLISIRRQANPHTSPPTFTRAGEAGAWAAWRLPGLELVVNGGRGASSVETEGDELVLTAGRRAAVRLEPGRLSLPEWSAAVLRLDA